MNVTLFSSITILLKKQTHVDLQQNNILEHLERKSVIEWNCNTAYLLWSNTILQV